MARPPSPSTSFSARRRWGIFFSVLVSLAAVIALVVMLNYLGARHSLRFNWSTRTTQNLSPRTLGLLRSITNDVKVVIYYNKDNGHDSYVKALLKQYTDANSKISVQTVDYERDAAAARTVQSLYKLPANDTTIFDCNGKTWPVPDKMLWEYGPYRQVISDGQATMEPTIKAFHGEEAFSAALLNVINPQPLNASYLTTHGEHPLNDSQRDDGYWKFLNILALNNILATNLTLSGTNTVPADCSLLIIAGPQIPVNAREADKIRHYLAQGGRLLVLFNNFNYLQTGRYQATGLEPLLTEYGVDPGQNLVKDTENTTPGSDAIMVRNFNPNHPISSPFQSYDLALVSPRSVGRSKVSRTDSDPAKVTELAWTSENATLTDLNSGLPMRGKIPLVVAVEKANAKAGLADHAPALARIVAVGDSLCLDNQLLRDAPQNGEFASLAVNWLVNRQQLMEGVGSHPVLEYRLAITNSQLTSLHWIFLGGMPGGVLALGFLVWLRRRR